MSEDTADLVAEHGGVWKASDAESTVRFLCFQLRSLRGALQEVDADLAAARLASRELILGQGGALRTGRRELKNLYRQVGDQPSDDDELVGQIQEIALALEIVARFNR